MPHVNESAQCLTFSKLRDDYINYVTFIFKAQINHIIYVY